MPLLCPSKNKDKVCWSQRVVGLQVTVTVLVRSPKPCPCHPSMTGFPAKSLVGLIPAAKRRYCAFGAPATSGMEPEPRTGAEQEASMRYHHGPNVEAHDRRMGPIVDPVG